MSKTSASVKRKYIDKTYKQINCFFYADEPDKIKAAAKARGMTVIQYICYAINQLGDIQLAPHDKSGVDVLTAKRAAEREATAQDSPEKEEE